MIQRINIISLCPGEATLIASACRFLAIIPNLDIYLYANAEELSDLPDTCLHYSSIAAGQFSQESGTHFTAISAFSSLTSAKLYSNLVNKPFSTVYIQKHLAIAEPDAFSDIVWSQYAQGMELCCLAEDSNLMLPHSADRIIIIPDVTAFLAQDRSQSLLLTSNHQMILAAINTDFPAWDILHPELNAINLGTDLTPEANDHILYKLHAIQRLILKKGSLDIENQGISTFRALGKDDKHAYSFFARKYDAYMLHVDYEHWVNKILHWYREHSRRPLHRIFELACGTANVSSLLVSLGYEVSASDLSPIMLDEAWKKPFKPRLYQGSLTYPLPERNNDLILCLFDSINYLLNPREITQMLDQAYQALAPQGLLIFDISTRANSEENFFDTCSLTRYPDGVMVHNAWYEEAQMLQKSSLRFFRKAALGYSQLHEIHMQRVYLCRDLIRMINDSNLTIKGLYSLERVANLYPRSLDRIDEKFTRIFFVLGRETDA